MDEFGVLVENMGFRVNGKSAPMAKTNPKSTSKHPSRNSVDSATVDESYSFSVDELDGIFRSKHNNDKTQQPQSFFGQDDIFGAPITSSNQYSGVDLDSIFRGPNSQNFGTVNLNSKNCNAYGDLLGLGSSRGDGDHVDESFGSFIKSSIVNEDQSWHGMDDFISEFGGTARTNTRISSGDDLYAVPDVMPSSFHKTMIDDPFSVFESSESQSDFRGSLNKDEEKSSVKSLFDLSDLKLNGLSTTTNNSSSWTSLNNVDDIFSVGKGMETKKMAKQSSSSQSLYDDFFHEEKRPEIIVNSRPSSSTKMATSARHRANEFNFLFGEITTSSGEFDEIEGEPEERRRARLNRHIRTNERMAEALAEKNQRDLQIQWEKEEKHRIAERLDYNIKRWAAGKEGNLRALLSSLDEVLWADCSWRAVSLTDLISCDSVKKVYKKATLYLHPDKVQQKGANLEQKYIAEKVFDILKEAWTKFSADELR